MYVSSDSKEILDIAVKHGAIPIKRGKNLCGEVPDIPVFQHALKHMHPAVSRVVAVHANNPTIRKELIQAVDTSLVAGAQEVMTCRPIERTRDYHRQYAEIYGSIRGFSRKRLETYKDPYKPEPDVLIPDESIEIETEKSFKEALWQSKHR